MGQASSIARYEDYTQDHKYDFDSGVIVLARAGRTAGHRRIRIHGGVGSRIVRWKASRTGRPPVAPAHMDTINDRLLSSSVVAALPVAQPQSGTLLFTLEGEYRYVQTTPRLLGQNALPTGSHPYPIEPIDGAAEQKIASALSQATTITTVAQFDAAMTLVTNAVVNSGATEYNWPITVIPTYFTGQTIAG